MSTIQITRAEQHMVYWMFNTMRDYETFLREQFNLSLAGISPFYHTPSLWRRWRLWTHGVKGAFRKNVGTIPKKEFRELSYNLIKGTPHAQFFVLQDDLHKIWRALMETDTIINVDLDDWTRMRNYVMQCENRQVWLR